MIFLLLFLFAQSSLAKEDQQRSVLLLGQSCALSGPAENLGLEMRAGLQAAIAIINEKGGVKGRNVLLRSMDDGYEPDRAIRNTLELIQDDQVFLLIGEVGTPTAKAVVPIIEKYKIPFFAPFSGAELLRNPFHRYIINVRASYYQEMEALAAYFTEQLGMQRIACFYQNDSYGFAGLKGIELALQRRNLQLVSQGSYERNTVAVMGGLQEIYRAEPEAVILVGTYAACAEFIKLSKAKKPGPRIFGNISFVGTESLKNALGTYGDHVIVSQVVPFPWDNRIPLIREYREAMHRYQRDFPISFISLEGYIAGKLFAAIADAVTGELTREKFIQTMQQRAHFDLGGVIFQFGENDHQGMDSIYLTTIYPIIQKVTDN
ncbi:MAG: ABC transporter substrate-binding protein [Proteobacteria bacterium]|nr:ABC transporter substrate-binding protein [Pseudomonadota bacterium]MBU1420756.1 ABC transporter substrate-binding protein [Pseudomonadota bacterium]MBU1456401.1 ABC transporter substrate-binding protein [Pseudomonadota bacterium]